MGLCGADDGSLLYLIMKILTMWLVCSQILCAGDIPTLHFNNELTWKQIFDSGFRPKHLPGLERNRCVCYDQEFILQFKDRELKFKLAKGRTAFGFFYDDFLSMVWHQGAEALTLEEGVWQAGEFKRLFDGYIIQEITMPRLIDPSGLVDAGNAENNLKVRVGEYLIWYGFDNSMRKDKPIIPHFYIVWSFPGRPSPRLKASGDVVRPPEGYEWYSLDPKVHTPDPGSDLEPLSELEMELFPNPEIEIPVKETPVLEADEAEDKSPDKPQDGTDVSRLNWWMIGILGMIIAAVLFWFMRSKSNP